MNDQNRFVSIVLFLSAVCGDAVAEELIIHDYSCLKISAVRPSTMAITRSSRQTAENVRSEPEYVLETREYDLIADFVRSMDNESREIACPEDQSVLWVAELTSEVSVRTIAGVEGGMIVEGGQCRKLADFSLASLLE